MTNQKCTQFLDHCLRKIDMREIKFRVWYEDKMWPCSIHDDGWVTVWKPDENGNDSSYAVGCVNGGSKLLVPCEPMQYTGLKDKNGTEIWEGDIISLNGYEFTVEMPSIYELLWTGDIQKVELRGNEYDNIES